jgi:nucleoside-diphosphate-sugar epimerase
MILVSGGAGVMGSRLVRGLVDSGWKVRALTLPNDPFVSRLDGVDCEVFYGNISDTSSLKRAFDGVETVYHLAAIIIADNPALFESINVRGTQNMVEGAISAGVKHFILVSSASVVYPKTTPYSLSKRECERIVKEQSSMNYTIVRPTLAYEENGGQEFMMFMDYLKKYPIVPFIGRGRCLKNPVHVDDLMRGFLALAGNDKSFGKTYNFSGGEELTLWELARLMLEHQGVKKPFVPIPVSLCKMLSTIMEKTMKRPPLTWNAIAGAIQDANLDHSSATEDLGYNPIGVREGLQKCFPLACPRHSEAILSTAKSDGLTDGPGRQDNRIIQ